MLGIIIIAGGESIKTAGKTVDGRVEVEVVIVGEDDVEVPVQLGRGEFVEMAGDESKTYQIALGALDERTKRAHVSIGMQNGLEISESSGEMGLKKKGISYM